MIARLHAWLTGPERHPGWGAFRLLFAASILATWLLRWPHLDALYAADSVLVRAVPPLIAWSSPAVHGWAMVLLIGTILVATGRYTRAAAAAVLLAELALLVGRPSFLFRYDILSAWQAIVLLFAPRESTGSVAGRRVLGVVYLGLYAGTGLSKLASSLSWLWGAPLAGWLVDYHFAGGSWAAELSTHPAALAVMGLSTIVVEAGFPLVLVFPRLARAWIPLAVGLHVGVLVLMRVHTFSLVAIAGYPLLLTAADASAADAAIRRWCRAWNRRARVPAPASPPNLPPPDR